MDLKGIQYVVAVADAGSFTEAAKNLFVAQPALSRKVAQIEREFGAEFFVRSGRQVRLTEAGKVFCKRARHVLADCQRLEQDMDQFLRQVEALRLLYITDGEVPYVADMVRAVRKKYPNVEIYSQTLSTLAEGHGTLTQVLEHLRQKRLDALLVFQPELEDDIEWLGHKCIEPGGLCAFMAPGNPLYGKEVVSASELREHTLILPPSAFSPALIFAMRKALGEPPHIVFSRNSTDFRVKVITENYIGIMPASSRTLESNFLRCTDICDVLGGFNLEIAWAKDNENSALEKLRSIL